MNMKTNCLHGTCAAGGDDVTFTTESLNDQTGRRVRRSVRDHVTGAEPQKQEAFVGWRSAGRSSRLACGGQTESFLHVNL